MPESQPNSRCDSAPLSVPQSMPLTLQIDAIRSNLFFGLKSEDRQALGKSLDDLALIAEQSGQLELCLKAQATQALIQNTTTPLAGQWVHDLMQKISHFEWKIHSQSRS